MLKVELHTHTADDPNDRIPHTSTALIDRAAELNYHAIAITLHQRQLDIRSLTPYARERGITLIPGVERSIEGRHVLLLNFARGAEEIDTFQDLAHLRRTQRGLVIAPHPYFPASTCLLGKLEKHADLFDAVEFNAMYTRHLNFNRRAQVWAARYGKPLVGNCDVHRLRQLGSTYTLVDAEPHPTAICEAIMAGRAEIVSRPLATTEAVSNLAEMMLAHLTHWRRQGSRRRNAGEVGGFSG
jgi:predicted metal-dependent phosphoesterase TrpH